VEVHADFGQRSRLVELLDEIDLHEEIKIDKNTALLSDHRPNPDIRAERVPKQDFGLEGVSMRGPRVTVRIQGWLV
jgi:hypothetical protein